MVNMRKQAPPIAQEKEQVDISPSLVYLQGIDILDHQTSLKEVQIKTSFLLAVAGFLRPSNLNRISTSNSKVDSKGVLRLSTHSPKETRKGRRIIKSIYVKPLVTGGVVSSLCPV